MLQQFVLPIGHLDNARMAMPDTHGHDSTKSVQISAPLFVPDVLHFPFHQHDRLLVVEKNPRVEELFAQPQDFFRGGSVILSWLMIECRKFGCLHVGKLAGTANETAIPTT